MSYNPSPSAVSGQQFVSATVHLAGKVSTETGHASWTGVGHVMARVGGVIVYFLDRAAAYGFASAVEDAAGLGGQTFGHRSTGSLPASAALGDGQDASMVLRLRGVQDIGTPTARTAYTSTDGGAHIAVRVGGLTLVLRDQLALDALTGVTGMALRAADALWPDEDADLQLPDREPLMPTH